MAIKDLNCDNENNDETKIDCQPKKVRQTEKLRLHLTRFLKGGLGLRIEGGKECSRSIVVEGNELARVCAIREKSPAFLAGLRIGDRILGVDDVSLEGAYHREVVKAFEEAKEKFSVLVKRDVSTDQEMPKDVFNECRSQEEFLDLAVENEENCKKN